MPFAQFMIKEESHRKGSWKSLSKLVTYLTIEGSHIWYDMFDIMFGPLL